MDSKVALDAIETSLDVVEDRLDDLLVGNNKFVPWLHRGPAAVALVVGVSAATGAGVSFLVTRKVLWTKYEKLVNEEVAEAKRYYAVLNKKDEFADPMSTLEQLSEAVEDLGYAVDQNVMEVDVTTDVTDHVEKVVEAKELVSETATEVQNIFADLEVDPENGEEFTIAARQNAKDHGTGYVILQEEFLENEDEFEQSTVTYFEADDTLIDERDQVIPDHDAVIGNDNLTKFGRGSSDNNIVYVRNERLAHDFEVVRSKGSYTQEILGFDASLEHSEDSRPRKFRRYHE